MNQDDKSLIKRMNIHSDAIIINQTDSFSKETWNENGNNFEWYNLEERGVGLSRNNALLRATGNILLFADDDAFADFLAARVLLAPECAPLLPALALSIPFCAIHACCCGYYYGLKKTAVPAFSQVVEQCIRIFSVLLIVHVCRTNRIPITVLLAVWTRGSAGRIYFSFRAGQKSVWASRPVPPGDDREPDKRSVGR